nr:TPA_exp: holocytochrome c synthase [Coleochaete scutata]
MGNASSAAVGGGEAAPAAAAGSIPEKVHEMYYKVFPGANCPVTGAAPSEKEDEAAADACGGAAEGSGKGSKGYKHPHVYNVYGQRVDEEAEQERRARSLLPPICVYLPGAQEKINPLNRMPATPNQAPAPGQKEHLSVERQKSTIPKGGTDETWLYPSPQMFYNALVRKGKADGVQERDMEAVIATHNFVNESTWARMQRWEQLYGRMYPESEVHEPRLLQFRGRPHDLSPKARLKGMLGYGKPFDRHDWIVDRGGRSMRYVIDFYYNEAKSGTEEAFDLDVRPAVDSLPAVVLRVRMTMEDLMERFQGSRIPGALPAENAQQSTPQHHSTNASQEHHA